jgi:hypothetical protein
MKNIKKRVNSINEIIQKKSSNLIRAKTEYKDQNNQVNILK